MTHKRAGKYRIEACSTHQWSGEKGFRDEEVKYRRFIRRVALLPIRRVCTRARISWNTLSRMNNVSGRADSARHGPTFRRPGPNIDGRACACTRAILFSGLGEGAARATFTLAGRTLHGRVLLHVSRFAELSLPVDSGRLFRILTDACFSPSPLFVRRISVFDKDKF